MPSWDGPVVDLEGRRVIPGFVDAHMHPVILADFQKQITIMPPEITSIAELKEAVRKRRKPRDRENGLKAGAMMRKGLRRNVLRTDMIWMRSAVMLRCL